MNGKHPTSDNIAKTAYETVNRIQPNTERAEENIREKGARVHDEVKEYGENIGDYFRKRPFTTICIAAVGGLILGSLLRR